MSTINSGFSIGKLVAEHLVEARRDVDELRAKPGYMAGKYVQPHALVLALDGLWLHAMSFGPRCPDLSTAKPKPCHYVTSTTERRAIDAQAEKFVAQLINVYK